MENIGPHNNNPSSTKEKKVSASDVSG